MQQQRQDFGNQPELLMNPLNSSTPQTRDKNITFRNPRKIFDLTEEEKMVMKYFDQRTDENGIDLCRNIQELTEENKRLRNACDMANKELKKLNSANPSPEGHTTSSHRFYSPQYHRNFRPNMMRIGFPRTSPRQCTLGVIQRDRPQTTTRLSAALPPEGATSANLSIRRALMTRLPELQHRTEYKSPLLGSHGDTNVVVQHLSTDTLTFENLGDTISSTAESQGEARSFQEQTASNTQPALTTKPSESQRLRPDTTTLERHGDSATNPIDECYLITESKSVVPPPIQRRALVLSDESGRGINKILRNLLGSGYNVESVIKPDASLDNVLDSSHRLCNDFTRKDIVIIVAGCNDKDPLRLQSMLYSNLSHLANTNVLLCKFGASKYLNDAKVSSTFKFVCSRFPHVTYICEDVKHSRLYAGRNILREILRVEYKQKYLQYINNLETSHKKVSDTSVCELQEDNVKLQSNVYQTPSSTAPESNRDFL